ncbi:MAG: alpha/beta fold hydrolase BchO [Pseudolabrys sp.]
MVAHRQLSWEADGRDWPNREASRFIDAGGLRWHVQQMGRGPALLLLHGTGASTHSWRDLAPLLARGFAVVAPDLPGHGFTQAPPRRLLTLPGMTSGIGALLRTMDVRPTLVVGHSAGAAVMVRMTLDGLVAPDGLVSLNGALMPFRGAVGQFFSPLAKLLALNPLVPRMFARRAADPTAVERLIANTGSSIDETGMALYRRLIGDPRHVAAALGMMANWDLKPLLRDLPKLRVPLLLVAGGEDRTISSEQAFRIRDRVSSANVKYLRKLGHLAHEERPEEIVQIIGEFASSLRSPHIQ